ncbi:MAG: putative short-chain fatty acid transporter [Syntrophus sp. SKADARSKE-3]|nr:putative short-chain fatty acid transporter [Syntrophus sp. SKADARSKE-3]
MKDGKENDSKTGNEGGLERIGLALANWTEKWFPDALVFALLGIVIIFIIGLLLGESPSKLALAGGKTFWVLIPFTMQMAMIIIGGFVVASSPAIYWCIQRLAEIPKSPKAAITLIAFFSMVTSLISWGFSLIFSGLLVREMAPRVKGMDYRAAGAAAYLGLGAVWALGLSSSAALMMATKGSIPPKLYEISGLIPLTQTLFLWEGIATAAILIVVSMVIAYYSAPSAENARTAESFGIEYKPIDLSVEPKTKPGEWLEYSPVLNLLVAALLAWYLVDVFQKSPQGALAALDLNTYNLIFITIGLVLHWTPRRFMRSVSQSVPAVGGVLIQFPFYAVIFGMIVGTGISDFLAKLFFTITTHDTYSLLVALYSAVLGVFIPSGGSKWVIEAPYVLQAAVMHKVHLGWVVQIYNAAEALPNLINPFWMLPLLGLLGVKARDIVGYTTLQLIIHIPLVFFLCWLFAQSIPYIPPIK